MITMQLYCKFQVQKVCAYIVTVKSGPCSGLYEKVVAGMDLYSGFHCRSNVMGSLV